MASIRIAVVGIGNMGSRMATRLIDAGHQVTVVDPNPAAVAALVAHGAASAETAAAASADAQVVLTSLPHPDVFTSVISEIVGVAAAGTTVLDASTVDPATTRAAASRLAERGIRFLDIPVSGGVAGAESGDLVVMAGGPADVLEDSRPVLDVLAARIVHCGDTGTGQLTKLAHNLLTAINTVALGEVLTASVAEGADLGVLTDVLTAGLAGSKMLDYLPKTLFTEERPANFALNLMNKDIGLALTEFGSRPMFLGQVTRQLYNTAASQGHGGEDSTGVAGIYERLNRVRLAL
ncbi:NAD(P)-dependent oxidoreductase [Saccharopolyspora spinosa]|uniref:3-hydroxyisobutyrate dehydrogenase/2-hydroxy-3-oxopropionate reductase n=1 Tax=Saccharopolyspora spinosa TaxID=60894 RepID=A0A2N3XV89_SACSN|nr:NAD(P)-dependent oxidoreductase [Saccharopolyspora spinosa]PKW14569.1 3-hydroxyisobutyrate dehydrogenase/2-hydroxy-3-oxopropionate reductase [Saccharopolyspora spinosa]